MGRECAILVRGVRSGHTSTRRSALNLPSDDELKAMTGLDQEVKVFEPGSDVWAAGQEAARRIIGVYMTLLPILNREPANIWHIPFHVVAPDGEKYDLLLSIKIDINRDRNEGVMAIEFPFPIRPREQ